MKNNITKSLIIILLWCLSTPVWSQENIVRLSPDIGQGWLVLDNFNYDVSYWEIRILAMDYDSNDEITYELVDIIELVGTNYVQISRQFLDNPGYTLRVIAHLPSGGTIQQDVLISPMAEEWVGGNPWKFCKKFVCKGINYAYQIEHWTNSTTGQTQVRLNDAFSLDNPIYIYFSENAFNQITPSTTVNWPGMNPISFFDYFGIEDTYLPQYWEHSPWIIKFPKDPNNPKYDGQNNIITSNYIYGIAAGLGPWSGTYSNSCIMSNPLNDLYCSNSPASSSIPDLYHAILYMNQYTTPSQCGWPAYQCGTSANATPMSWTAVAMDTFKIPPLKDSIHWIWDLFTLGDKKFNGGDNPENWWENYHSISFSDISGISGEVFNVKISDIMINGEPDEVPVYLNPGLFVLGMVDIEGNYIPIFIEKQHGDYIEPTPMANEIQVNIFPVPHTENSFNMTLTSLSDVEMTVNYLLYSNQSILLHESTMIISPGASETLWMNPSNELPNGVLYHTFVFEDNSYKTICSVKSN
jgi:hypothetical protein